MTGIAPTSTAMPNAGVLPQPNVKASADSVIGGGMPSPDQTSNDGIPDFVRQYLPNAKASVPDDAMKGAQQIAEPHEGAWRHLRQINNEMKQICNSWRPPPCRTPPTLSQCAPDSSTGTQPGCLPDVPRGKFPPGTVTQQPVDQKPPKVAVTPCPPPAKVDDCHSNHRGSYTIKPGDTLSKIASKYQLSWQQVFAANHTSIKNPNLIFPGQVLKIPSCDTKPGTVPTPAPPKQHVATPPPPAAPPKQHLPKLPTCPPVTHKPPVTQRPPVTQKPPVSQDPPVTQKPPLAPSPPPVVQTPPSKLPVTPPAPPVVTQAPSVAQAPPAVAQSPTQKS